VSSRLDALVAGATTVSRIGEALEAGQVTEDQAGEALARTAGRTVSELLTPEQREIAKDTVLAFLGRLQR
jgi:hypothetical protein